MGRMVPQRTQEMAKGAEDAGHFGQKERSAGDAREPKQISHEGHQGHKEAIAVDVCLCGLCELCGKIESDHML